MLQKVIENRFADSGFGIPRPYQLKTGNQEIRKKSRHTTEALVGKVYKD